MARVINTKPNASENISNVAFMPCDRGMLSEEISDEAAARFLRIPGYITAGDDEGGQPPVTTPLTAETYAELRAPQVIERLKADPESVDTIESFESAREAPRQTIVKAIADLREAVKTNTGGGE